MKKNVVTQQRETKIGSLAQFLDKAIINVGVGRLSQQQNFEEKILVQVKRDIALLCGQEPQVRRAKKSIAGFKLREGQIVGLRATLRGKKMVDFVNRLIMIVLPRVRDFRGINLKSIDESGILNIGINEQTVFPEINVEQSPLIFSLGINIVPKGRSREAALRVYRHFGVPLKKA